MTIPLSAIRETVHDLLDEIERAKHAHDVPRPESDDPVVRQIERHPFAYAIAMFGMTLIGGHLIARARRNRPSASTGVSWWVPAPRGAQVH